MKFNNVFTKEKYEAHLAWLNGEQGQRLNLSGTDLSWVDLRNTDLRNADLIGADLRCADLRNADLRNADLRNADLTWTDLRWVNLSGTLGDGVEIKSLNIGTYPITYTKDIVNIGCESHTLEEWKAFDDEEIKKMDSQALAWWKLNRDIVISLVERETKDNK